MPLRTLASAVLSLVLLPLAAHAQLPPPVARALAEAGLPEDAVGLVVAPLHAGPRFLEHGAERPLQPGSTMKLVTTLVGLEQLGPAWRGRTRLLAAGAIRDGVLEGDLVLQGGADADLDTAALTAMLRRARDHGLREVRGALVVDRSLFVPARPDLGAPPFDEWPEAEYNVIPDALLVGTNLLRIELFADERGLQVVPQTALAGVRVTHEMALVEGDCTRWDEGWRSPEVRRVRATQRLDVVLRGTWPSGCERSLGVSVLDRNDFVERHVRALWSALGGRWRGRLREGVAPQGAQLLAEHRSRPLAELVRAMNKPSDNALARLLYLVIGAAADGASAEPTHVRAERAVRGWLRQRGIDDAGFVVDNGSGLSRSERLTAAQLEAVVRAGHASRWAPEFVSSLPIAGTDGTLRTRLAGSPAAGWARLKTGTLRNAVAIAGTVRDGAGVPRIAVMIVNHDLVRLRQTRAIVDLFVDWVARTRFASDALAVPARPPASTAVP